MAKIRLDEALVAAGYYPDRDVALRAILAREVKVGDEYAVSAAQMITPGAPISIKESKRFASRGGIKLQAALDAFGQRVVDLRCVDVGSSTGGFTDCLLQAGASSVACIDVNYGQLAWELRTDPRVSVFERTNIKTADAVSVGAPFDLAVADLSFIGLAQLAPVFARLVGAGGVFIGLVKPQFESRHDETTEGVVTDPAVRERTVAEVAGAFDGAGFDVRGIIESPLHGKRKGNVEYLVKAVRRSSR